MADKQGFSISTFTMIESPLEAAIDQLISGGWKSIEIMCEDRHREILQWPSSRIEALIEQGKRHHIRWSFHAPVFTVNPCAMEEAERKSSMAILHQAMDIAQRLACSHVVIHAGESDEAQDSDEARDRCVRFVQDVLAARPASSMKLVLENVPPKPRLQGVSIDFVKSVVEQVSHPQFGILLDIGHAHVCGPDQAMRALELSLPHLAALHLNDNEGDADTHLAVGMGNIPYSELVPLLMKHAFQGTWVIETESVEWAEVTAHKLAHMRKQHQ